MELCDAYGIVVIDECPGVGMRDRYSSQALGWLIHEHLWNGALGGWSLGRDLSRDITVSTLQNSNFLLRELDPCCLEIIVIVRDIQVPIVDWQP